VKFDWLSFLPLILMVATIIGFMAWGLAYS